MVKPFFFFFFHYYDSVCFYKYIFFNFQIYPKILLRIVVELELHYLCVNIVLCYWVCVTYWMYIYIILLLLWMCGNSNIVAGLRFWIVIRILLVGRMPFWRLEMVGVSLTKLRLELVCVGMWRIWTSYTLQLSSWGKVLVECVFLFTISLLSCK